jgi:F-type H+-transporting ATPase subunit b
LVFNLLGLEISIPTLIWTVINFFLLLFLLNKFLFKPVMKFVDQRNEKIKAGIQEGKDAEKLLAETQGKLKEELAEANAQAREIIEKGKTLDAQKRAKSLEGTHKQVSEMKEKIRVDIKSEESTLKEEIDKQMPEMVDDFVKSLLKYLTGRFSFNPVIKTTDISEDAYENIESVPAEKEDQPPVQMSEAYRKISEMKEKVREEIKSEENAVKEEIDEQMPNMVDGVIKSLLK